MASQHFDFEKRILRVDLHGCTGDETAIIVPTKFTEALECGSKGLLLIYGKSGSILCNRVHGCLHTTCIAAHFSLTCLDFSRGGYSETSNGSEFDVAVLIIFQFPKEFRPFRFSGFRVSHGAGVEPISTADVSARVQLDMSPTLLLKVHEVANRSEHRKPSPLQTESQKNKAIVYPPDWIRPKR
jgi:hypothetical protein